MEKIIFSMLALIFSIISLKYLSLPFIYIMATWFAVFSYLTLKTQHEFQKGLYFNLAFLLLILGMLETYSYVSLSNTEYNIRAEGTIKDSFQTNTDILGYAPKKNIAVSSKKYLGKNQIYDVTYTINKAGLRISSLSEKTDENACVHFFGGSYTFGEGVEDAESMPYLVQNTSTYHIYNHGFSGYGPHQMLSEIQHGLRAGQHCKSNTVVYQAIEDHVLRSAGLSTWDTHGPKYVIQQDGSLKAAGNFDDGMFNKINRKIKLQLIKSYAYKKYFIKGKPVNDNEIKLFLMIVKASKDAFNDNYPGSDFHVIYWDDPKNKHNKSIIDGLNQYNISVHLISKILPDYLINQSQYQISAQERHPNTHAQALIAAYVKSEILKK